MLVPFNKLLSVFMVVRDRRSSFQK
jgi:hypothetical protein